MRELHAILEAIQESQRTGKTAILATVVQVEGSAYRRPGARMLLTEDGWRAGSVSGGCLESDLLERAWPLTASGEPALLTYDTTEESDSILGVGVGCRGVVRVLIERLAPGRAPDPIGFLRECLQQRQAGALVTVFSRDDAVQTRVGACLLLRGDGRVSGDIEDVELAARAEQDARRALQGGRSEAKLYPLRAGTAAVFIEVVRPPVPLVVFGAGHDALPMARLAKELGWHVTVVDARPAYATRGRFPEADDVVLCPPEAIPTRVRLDPETVALVMTHNYLQDQRLLEVLLPSPVRYLGILGPRSRTRRLLADLAAQGLTWTEGQLERLYAPVGLDIGADGPEEIALAVLAEIQAALAGRSGGSLRQRAGTIHGTGGAEPAMPGPHGSPHGSEDTISGAGAACGRSAW
jgi:xanthine/CO dehydrogenase XdhC/CoxF family maturation factor